MSINKSSLELTVMLLIYIFNPNIYDISYTLFVHDSNHNLTNFIQIMLFFNNGNLAGALPIQVSKAP